MMKDMTGREYIIGDKVAYAAVYGRSSYIRVGMVEGFTPAGGLKLRITETGYLGIYTTHPTVHLIYPERARILET